MQDTNKLQEDRETLVNVLEQVKLKGGKLSKSTGHVMSDKGFNELFHGNMEDFYAVFGTTLSLTEYKDSLVGILTAIKTADKPVENYDIDTVYDPMEWVNSFMVRWKLTVPDFNPLDVLCPAHPDTDMLPTDVEVILRHDLAKYNAESRIWDSAEGKYTYLRARYEVGEIIALSEGAPAVAHESNKGVTRDVLKYNPDIALNGNQWIDYCLACLGNIRPLDIIMLKQWMWQVKRYMYGMQVYEPYFINIFGPTGGGKSDFVKGLCHPLRVQLSTGKSLDVIKDKDRSDYIFAKNLIVFFDEMIISRENKLDAWGTISAFKNLLTTTELQPRKFNTQTDIKMKRIFSGIGCSNEHLTSIINDPTGMRRFYEIECANTREKKMYMGIPFIRDTSPATAQQALVTFGLMWQSINENLEKGYLTTEHEAELHAVQSTYKRMNCIDMYETFAESATVLMRNDDPTLPMVLAIYEQHKNSPMDTLNDALIEMNVEATNINNYRKKVISHFNSGTDKNFRDAQMVYGYENMVTVLRNNHHVHMQQFKKHPIAFHSINQEE